MSVYVDLKRVFETIAREKLVGVLQKYKIRDTALKWFSSYLENRTQITRYNSEVSPETPIDLGVLCKEACKVRCCLYCTYTTSS